MEPVSSQSCGRAALRRRHRVLAVRALRRDSLSESRLALQGGLLMRLVRRHRPPGDVLGVQARGL